MGVIWAQAGLELAGYGRGPGGGHPTPISQAR